MNNLDLSKEVSYVLRHAPWKYGLVLDENGWVDVRELLEALRKNYKWVSIELDDLFRMIEESENKRHEIVGKKIRALYGHSTSLQIKGEGHKLKLRL